jgi:hypothetical protein
VGLAVFSLGGGSSRDRLSVVHLIGVVLGILFGVAVVLLVFGTVNAAFDLGVWRAFDYPILWGSDLGYGAFAGQYVPVTLGLGIAWLFVRMFERAQG